MCGSVGPRVMSARRLLTKWPTHASPVDLLVDLADLVDDPGAQRMLHVEDLLERPVEVVGNVRDLFEQTVGRVRHDPPDGSPAMSTVNSVEQCGHVTAAWLCPS